MSEILNECTACGDETSHKCPNCGVYVCVFCMAVDIDPMDFTFKHTDENDCTMVCHRCVVALEIKQHQEYLKKKSRLLNNRRNNAN